MMAKLRCVKNIGRNVFFFFFCYVVIKWWILIIWCYAYISLGT